MKHVRLAVALALTAGLAVASCTTAQTDRFVSRVTNFNRGLAAVDEAVKNINATVYSNCEGLVQVASAINDISGSCNKVSSYTSVANSIVDNYCQAQGVQSAGVAKSIGVTASGISAAKSQLSASKKACAS